MITKELLIDIGFEKGTGWGHDVYVYDGEFWVYFIPQQDITTGIEGRHISYQSSLKDFFKMFIKAIKDDEIIVY